MKRTISLFVIIFSLFYKHEAAIVDKFFTNNNNSFVSDEIKSRSYGDLLPATTTSTTTTTVHPLIPIEIPDYFTCPQKTGQYPHAFNHSQYYICNHFEPNLRTCLEGFLYDVTTKKCEDEDIAKCVKTPPPLRSGDDQYFGIDETFVCFHNGVYPYKEECDKYIACIQGVPYIYKCWTKLFDIGLNSCNFVELTDCGDRKRPTGLPGTITPPTTPSPTTPTYECPTGNGHQLLYADPYDCTAFYYCAQGRHTRSICPLGHNEQILYFHEMRQQCDHPANVPCSNAPK